MTSGFIVDWFWGLERVESLRLLLLGLLFEVDLLGFMAVLCRCRTSSPAVAVTAGGVRGGLGPGLRVQGLVCKCAHTEMHICFDAARQWENGPCTTCTKGFHN